MCRSACGDMNSVIGKEYAVRKGTVVVSLEHKTFLGPWISARIKDRVVWLPLSHDTYGTLFEEIRNRDENINSTSDDLSSILRRLPLQVLHAVTSAISEFQDGVAPRYYRNDNIGSWREDDEEGKEDDATVAAASISEFQDGVAPRYYRNDNIGSWGEDDEEGKEDDTTVAAAAISEREEEEEKENSSWATLKKFFLVESDGFGAYNIVVQGCGEEENGPASQKIAKSFVRGLLARSEGFSDESRNVCRPRIMNL